MAKKEEVVGCKRRYGRLQAQVKDRPEPSSTAVPFSSVACSSNSKSLPLLSRDTITQKLTLSSLLRDVMVKYEFTLQLCINYELNGREEWPPWKGVGL